jgi:DNA-directed RNA polymerase subunit K/omega
MESVTTHPLTKYERIQVIGVRSEQLARGSHPFVEPNSERAESPYEIAERELKSLRLPMIVMRTLPDGKPQYIRLSDGVSTTTIKV